MPFDPEYRSDLAACRDMLRGGSRTFFAAARVLPARVARPATALYAFCRLADDLIDCDGDGGGLAALRERLNAIYAGRPLPHPADRALAGVVARFALPQTLLDALLEGFAWDASGRRFETLDELHDYAARVAGSVGAAMAVLMGVRAPALVARACDLGAAMQLTNIARDVGEDARAGRLYLPLQWLREAGLDPEEFVARPCFSPALGGVVRNLLDAAAVLYDRADGGIAGLPWDCRPGIAAARMLYARIGAEVARNGYDSVSRRAVVPAGRKAWLVGRATLASLNGAGPAAAPPLPACRFLVAAIVPAPRRPARPSFDDRVAWLCDLFARLEQRQAMGPP